jgi:hypothetical protein
LTAIRKLPTVLARTVALASTVVSTLALGLASASAAPAAEPWTGGATLVSTTTGNVIAARLTNGSIEFWWQNFNQEVWHPETVARAAHGVRYGLPEMAWTGHSVVIVATDSAGRLNLWWEEQFSNTWHHEVVASRGYSVLGYDANDVTAIRGGLAVAAETKGGAVYDYTQTTRSTRWRRQLVTASLDLAGIAWTGSVTGIAADDQTGSLYYLWEKPGTTPWHRERIAGVPASGAWVGYPDLTVARRTLVVTAGDNGGDLYAWVQPPGKTTWHRETLGTGRGHPEWGQPTAAWTGRSLVVAGVSNILAGSVYVWTQRSGASAWLQQLVAQAQPPTGLYSGPTVSWNGSQITLASVQGSNIWFWSRPLSGSGWSATLVGSI